MQGFPPSSWSSWWWLQVLLHGWRATASLLLCQGLWHPRAVLTLPHDMAAGFGLVLTHGSLHRAPSHPEPLEISLAVGSWVTLTCLTILSQGPMLLLFVLLGGNAFSLLREKTPAVSGWIIFHCFHSNSIIAPAAKILNLRWKCLPGISPLLSPVARSPVG